MSPGSSVVVSVNGRVVPHSVQREDCCSIHMLRRKIIVPFAVSSTFSLNRGGASLFFAQIIQMNKCTIYDRLNLS